MGRDKSAAGLVKDERVRKNVGSRVTLSVNLSVTLSRRPKFRNSGAAPSVVWFVSSKARARMSGNGDVAV